MKVQVFGLQRSGTNYLHWVLSKNFPVKTTKDGGWKHGFPWERRIGLHGAEPLDTSIAQRLIDKNIQPVVVRKDLEHWLPSIDREPKDYHKGAGAVEGDRAKAWERYYREWAEHAPIVRYEDFLADFDAALRSLGDLIGVSPVRADQPTRVPNSRRWRPSDRKRYI